jgi:hypothetical protein
MFVGQHSGKIKLIYLLDLNMVSDIELVLIFYKMGKGENLITATVDRCSWKFGSLNDFCPRRNIRW